MTITSINVWLRARGNGVDTRIADLLSLTSRCEKKMMGGVSERREKKLMMVSKSGTTTDFSDRLWNGGAADANSVDNNNYSTHNHGWIGVGKRDKSTWPRVELVCGLELVRALTYNTDNTGRFGKGMTFLARMDCV